MTTPISAHGVRVGVPTGWDARIYRRAETGDGTTHAVLHAATFPLPEQRGDFGSGAVELMGPSDVFVSLIEFHPEAADKPLFRRGGLPRPLPASAFDPNTLQRALPGQAGAQLFFNHGGRAWCLYVVIGSSVLRRFALPKVNSLLQTIDLAVDVGK
jgi:hypothetical protein